MSKIRVLPDNLSNQIAAGEVVERPASVIKELVENSIDAGATRVHIDVELGGRRLMRITDNGEGMMRDDAILAFERHATSKIKSLEDLSKIETLGFRGEALASIASVAKIELLTKTESETVGTRVVIEGGRLIDVKDAARPTGTTLCVRDLFFNTPARRKFMRSEATENYHLASIVTHYALAHPEISFVLTSNGREVLRVSTAKDLRERAFQIFGSNLIESLLQVDGGREYIAKIKGYISAPRERRTTRDAQYFFINGRFVRDKLLSRALTEGFRAVLPHGVYPVAFLFLDVPLEEVDVNVHPAKTEVRFRRAEAVRDVIAEAIRKALTSAGIIREEIPPIFDGFKSENEPDNRLQINNYEQQKIELFSQESAEINATETPFSFNETNAVEPDTMAQHVEIAEPKIIIEDQTIEVYSKDFEDSVQAKNERSENFFQSEIQPVEGFERSQSSLIDNISFTDARPISLNNSAVSVSNYGVMPPVDSGANLPKSVPVESLSAAKIRPIGQLHDSYIIAIDDEGMLLIDQHVAHERILFDKFRRKEVERDIKSQNLLLPETIDLAPAQAVSFEYIEPELERLGFSTMRLSGRTVAIKSIPADIPARDVRNLLVELIETVDKEKRGNAIETIRDNLAASLACKAAVKINMKLTIEKMQWLIDRLAFTTSPTTCPHGRPIVLRITMKDIERAFHRT
jgi:DNA mismatch repair protein MutL